MRLLFSIVFVVGFVGMSFAQMTDDQVIELLKKAQGEGKSQQEMLLLLKERGVTQEQMLRLKAQYEKMKTGQVGKGEGMMTGSRLRSVDGDSDSALDSLFMAADTIRKPKDLSDEVFGRNFFNNKKLTFEPQLNIPTPEHYKLAAGDEVIVDIWGASELTVKQLISPEGSILVQNLGPIYLNGLSIKEAESKLKREFAKSYADLVSASPQTFMKLSLGKIRSIQINVMGEAMMPGTYTLPSLATVFHALYSAGGVNEVGTLRAIQLYRAGKLVQTIDVYRYLLSGDDRCDITLQDGDNIIIPPYKKLVAISGPVKRPMRYELLDGESLGKLLEYAGGFKGEAYKKNIRLTRKGDSEYQVFTIKQEEIPAFGMLDGDVVAVDPILDRFENRVTIRGAVYRPGVYAINDAIQTLSQLVAVAEGVKGDAFMDRVLLYRENPDLTQKVEAINLAALLAGEVQDVALQKNDVLYIPSIFELEENFVVRIRGEVKRPGQYRHIYNMTLEDLVLQAGGLLESASTVRVDVSRRVKDPKSTTESPVEAKVYTFALKDGLVIEGDKDFVLEPFDEVDVRRSPGYKEQQNIVVQGEVMYEGVYAKSVHNERLTSVIQRAGGVSSNAYIQGARLERRMNADERRKVQSVLKLTQGVNQDSVSTSLLDIGDTYFVGIELDKALANPGSDYDVVLREGDRIIIPVYNGTVKIGGAVMYPNTVTYNPKKKIKSYIENAGGFAFRAKKSRMYIVYMNGTVAKAKRLAVHQVQPGCEIIVPFKPGRKGDGLSLPEIMSLASSTTSIAALVTSIINTTK